MEYMEISAKTVNDAITEACQKLLVTSDKLEYTVVEEGSSGFLGIGSKPAIIKARVKSSVTDNAKEFLDKVFQAMNLIVVVDIKYDELDNYMNIDLSGDEMGVLIGKRGQTLDSLQYLVSLVVNKESENYIRVKVDTEQGMTQRIASVDEITGTIQNGELFYDFTDDGWGGTGTLHIMFLPNQINVDVLNYQMAEENVSGYGISGMYEMKIRE